MSEVTLTIDNRQVTVPEGSTILEAAEKTGIHIPTLCHHPDQEVKAVCRVCVVEIEKEKTLQPACAFPVREGMRVFTNSSRVREARRIVLELILARHPLECPTCERNLHCELQDLAESLGIRETRFGNQTKDYAKDTSSPAIIRDPNKCILCRRCVYTCEEVQGVKILYPSGRGADTFIGPPFEQNLNDVWCVNCGQCIHACPVGAITERDDTEEVYRLLDDPDLHVVVQTAPAIRATLGEELGCPPGTRVTKKMVAALRTLGFDKVFDTDFSADLTIMEEGSELIERLENGGPLPLLTSCSPGWIKFLEHFYPELIPNVSTCKSPQQMFGALAKTYYAEKTGIPAEQIRVISVMPCTAKKFEAKRPEMSVAAGPDVDVVLTTRELGRMLRSSGTDFAELPEDEFDAPLGISTGAGAIFGATGGVMEAALRTAYELVTGTELEQIDFAEVRGMTGIKTAEVQINGTTVRVGVAHGLGNARKLLDMVVSKQEEFHFIEIMACPGGCIGGGGQPIPTNDAVREKRIAAIYDEDRNMKLRKSHENPAVKKLYEEFLEKPLGKKSHELLHTTYRKRELY